MAKFICKVKCWFGEKLWEVGDVLEHAGKVPEHFKVVSSTTPNSSKVSPKAVFPPADGAPVETALTPAPAPVGAAARAASGEPVALSEIAAERSATDPLNPANQPSPQVEEDPLG